MVVAHPGSVASRLGGCWIVVALCIWGFVISLNPLALLFALGFAGLGVCGILRYTAFVRPGRVRPGLGRGWVDIDSPSDFVIIDVGPLRHRGITVVKSGVSTLLMGAMPPVHIVWPPGFTKSAKQLRHEQFVAHARVLARCLAAPPPTPK